MKTAVAIIMGFFSGFLIYMMFGMAFVDFSSPGSSSRSFLLLVFFGGWALSSWIIRRDAISLSKVFSRGFLLGAAEWLCMFFAGIIFSGKAVSSTITATSSGAETAGAAFGGGIFAFITGTISIVMAVTCLMGFVIAYFMGREMKPEEPAATKKCPQCAETIKAEARICRYCGATISTGRNGTLPLKTKQTEQFDDDQPNVYVIPAVKRRASSADPRPAASQGSYKHTAR